MRPVAFLVAMTIALGARAGGDPRIEEAERRFAEGKQLFSERKYADAHVRFTEACAAHHTANCPKNLGFAEFRLQRYPEAATHLREFTKLSEYATDPDREVVAKIFAEVTAKTSTVTVLAADGAAIEIDGRPVGRAPLDANVFVLPGHRVIATTIGNERSNKTVDVEAGKNVDVDLRAARALPTATVTSSSSSAPPPLEIERRPGAGYAVPIALGIVGLAAVAMGAGFAVDASSQSNFLNTTAPGVCNDRMSVGCAARQNAIDAHGRDDVASMALFVGGGVALAAAIVTWFIWPRSRVSVSVRESGGGFSLRF